MDIDKILSFWGHHAVMISIWLMLTLSLNMINGFGGLFSLGHQGFWAIGAYAAGATINYLPGNEWMRFVLSFPAGMLGAAIFGFLVGLPCLRLRGDYLAIATLGFSEIVRNLIQNSEALGRSAGMSLANVVRNHFERSPTTGVYLLLGYGAVVLTLIVLRNIVKSPHGRALCAMRDDERAAELVGVNLTFYKVFVFVLGASFAGLAGAMYANYNAFISPDDFNFNTGVLMVVMVVLGGMGSFTGTIVATVVLYMIPIVLQLTLPETKIPVFYDPTVNDQVTGHVIYRDIKELWQVLFSFLLIVVVLVRPEGIMSGREFRLPWRKRAEGKA